MSWLMILGLAAIIFFNRYYFLEPNVKVKLPVLMNKMLNYSAPCLLSAICIPVIFFENNELRGFLDNPYLYATIFCTANSNMRCDSFKSHMIINKLSKFL